MPVLKDSTAESFVSGLKKLSGQPANSPPSVQALLSANAASGTADGDDTVSRYDYVPLEFDSSASRVTIKLPPCPYAVQLVQQFETYIGYEYHWYLHRPFHADLDSTYRQPQSVHARDRLWLCKLLTVLALGESYNAYHTPSIEIMENGNDQPLPTHVVPPVTPPGATFFESALDLFKVPHEEPIAAHVEVLNLIVSCLNKMMAVSDILRLSIATH